MKEYMVSAIYNEMVKSMGVKESVAKLIDIDGFVNTLLALAKLDRNTTAINGESLTDYKLDSRLAGFVTPRGIYASADIFALNVLKSDQYDNDKEALSASEFMKVQANMLGSMRKAVSYNTDLLEASNPKTLAEVMDRVAKDGKCNYHGEIFMPIHVDLTLYTEFWYNYECKDMIEQLVTTTFAALR